MDRTSATLSTVRPPEDSPAWQRVLVLLRGSSIELPNLASFASQVEADPAWTQRSLSDATGLDVRRISEFPRRLNATSAQKVREFLPGWDEQRLGGNPRLVEVHRGAVRGLSGAWVYYRLTPLGERLAEVVARAAAMHAPAADDPPLPASEPAPAAAPPIVVRIRGGELHPAEGLFATLRPDLPSAPPGRDPRLKLAAALLLAIIAVAVLLTVTLHGQASAGPLP